MKKILLFIVLLMPLVAGAQIRASYPIPVSIGSNGYVTIGLQDYSRNEIGFSYNYSDSFKTQSGRYDSTVSIYWQRDGSALYSHVLDTMFVFGDSTNKQVKNIITLRNWFKTNAYYRGN